MAQQPLAGGMPAQSNGQTSVSSLANWTLRKLILATMTVLAVTLAFVLLFRFYHVIFLLFVSVAIQIALDPLVRWLTGRGINKIAALFIIYLALFVLIGAVLWYGTIPLVDQVRDVVGTLPGYYSHMRDSLLHAPVGLVRGLASVLPAEPSLPMLMSLFGGESGAAAPAVPAAAEAAGEVNTAAAAVTGASPAQSWGWIVLASKGFFGLFAVFAIAFYWTLEGDVIVRKLILQAPAGRREELRALVAESQSKIGAFFRGQLILCSIIGLASTAAYLLLGIPNAFLLGLLMALFESVPLIGPFLGAVPALIVTMSAAPDKVLLVIAALLIIQTAEANLLVPRVMDHSVGVNPIISMLALAAFGALFGLLGALLAVPMAAILQIVLNRVLFKTPISEETAPATNVPADMSRSRLGVLRLEAQHVMQAVRKQARSAEESGASVEDGAEQTEDDIEAIAAELDSVLASAEEADKEAGEETA